MGKKVTTQERELIEELLLEGYTPKGAAMLVGRGERTGFYVQAEMRRRREEGRVTRSQNWLTDLLRGVFYARKEVDSSRGGTPWWAKK